MSVKTIKSKDSSLPSNILSYNVSGDSMTCVGTITDLPTTDIATAGLDTVAVGYCGYPYVYEYYWHDCYPCYHTVYEKSKIDIAFKVCRVLMNRKIIKKNLTVEEFIELVHELAKEL